MPLRADVLFRSDLSAAREQLYSRQELDKYLRYKTLSASRMPGRDRIAGSALGIRSFAADGFQRLGRSASHFQPRNSSPLASTTFYSWRDVQIDQSQIIRKEKEKNLLPTRFDLVTFGLLWITKSYKYETFYSKR
jgi:hypothetical protein